MESRGIKWVHFAMWKMITGGASKGLDLERTALPQEHEPRSVKELLHEREEHTTFRGGCSGRECGEGS